MAIYSDISFRVGVTKYKRKRRSPPMSSSPGNNRGRSPKLVSYCPICPLENHTQPYLHPHATVTVAAKKASCLRGHVWAVIG